MLKRIIGGSIGSDRKKYGAYWIDQFPYALPNLLGAILAFFTSILVGFGLEEVRTLYAGETCRMANAIQSLDHQRVSDSKRWRSEQDIGSSEPMS